MPAQLAVAVDQHQRRRALHAVGAHRQRKRVVGFGAGRISIGVGKIEALYPLEGSLIIRSDAPFAAGASGGALFDDNQKLVGVLTFYRRGVKTSSYWAMPAEWVNALKDADLPAMDRSRLPIWTRERAASIRFLQVAGHEIDGDWIKMSETARLWAAEEPESKEAVCALRLAVSRLSGLNK